MEFKSNLKLKGDLTTEAGIYGKIKTITNTYTVLVDDETVICNKSSDFTVTLPVATIGQTYRIKNIGTGKVTVDGDSSDTVDGDLTQVLHQWEGILLQCAVANTWIIV